jgi:hypothetical protein
MTHSEDNCPAYQPEVMKDFIEKADNLDAVAQELGVKIHNIFWGAPEHVAFALLETDNIAAISRLVFAMPFRQDFKVTAIQDLKEIIVTGKAMLEKMNK